MSGFFGGVSGHQGALRSAFLAKCRLDTKTFIGTNTVCAVVVDVFRLAVYGAVFYSRHVHNLSSVDNLHLVWIATLAAFLGSFIGMRLMKKVTIDSIRIIVGVMLLSLAGLLAAGII